MLLVKGEPKIADPDLADREWEANTRPTSTAAPPADAPKEADDLIGEALRTLTEKERAAIVLRDLEGLTTEEVAEALGSSPTTVRSQISSARVKIKKFRDRYRQRHL